MRIIIDIKEHEVGKVSVDVQRQAGFGTPQEAQYAMALTEKLNKFMPELARECNGKLYKLESSVHNPREN